MRRKNASETEISALFESGTPLDSAWIEFSPAMDRFAYEALRTDPADDGRLRKANPQRYEQLVKGWLPKTWPSRQKKLTLRTHDERANLLYGIYHGDFWAIGFRTLSDGSDELIRVPRQHFFVDYDREEPFPDLNWSKGELRVGDTSFFGIHVIRAPDRAETPPNTDPVSRRVAKTGSVSPRGRPNTKDVIRDQVAKLLTTDPAFLALPNRTAQAEEVRARLCGEDARTDHERVGFKTTTIVKIIGQVARSASE